MRIPRNLAHYDRNVRSEESDMTRLSSLDAALDVARRLPLIQLAEYPTPVQELARLRASLGAKVRLLVKRDDAISFAFGGNKVRKLELVAAAAMASGADTLVTAGAVQSNHARVTAATAAKLGLDCVIVASGTPASTGNALLDRLLGARVEHVTAPSEREPRMHAVAERLSLQGRRPFLIPVGASNATGALAYVRAVDELAQQGPPPDVIVHASSSAGTQAGLVVGCRLLRLPTRVVGISADEAAEPLRVRVTALVRDVVERLRLSSDDLPSEPAVEVDDGFVGPGYGVPTDASREAVELAARAEALFLDPTYTSKAMAGLIAYLRDRRLGEGATVLFWHTGGQVGLFA